MPNHVTNKIVMKIDPVIADGIFKAVCPNGKFDFEALVPTPLNVYQGGLGRDEDADFPINWNTWNRANWGTKWNCYEQTLGTDEHGSWIEFDTAWSVPYPIIAAFANKFGVEFEHRYFDEGHNFWGIETWGIDKRLPDNTIIQRLTKRKSDPADKRQLCIELKGYDPDLPEDGI